MARASSISPSVFFFFHRRSLKQLYELAVERTRSRHGDIWPFGGSPSASRKIYAPGTAVVLAA